MELPTIVEFTYNDIFLSVLAEFLSFMCIQVQLHHHFAHIFL